MIPSLVSIIVTTKNEEKNIANCLLSITEQTYPYLEIILVDNNSSDKTREIALEYTDKIFIKGPERSAQRNYGMIKVANGKYVMFLDADMVLAPKALETCISMADSGQWVALHIPEFVLGKKYFSRVRRFERSFYDGTVIDGARFFKKSVFEEIGGFDETMSGPEDWDIDKKLKNIGPIGLLPLITEYPKASSWKLAHLIIEGGVDPNGKWNCIFHNEAEFKLVEYLSKKKYYSASIDKYTKKWGENDPDIRKQIGIWYRFFGVFLEGCKWKRFLLNPYLVLGVYFLRFLVGLQFLKRNLS
jgi:glycosyltransferase involved in cell wall biosynthesis